MRLLLTTKMMMMMIYMMMLYNVSGYHNDISGAYNDAYMMLVQIIMMHI